MDTPTWKKLGLNVDRAGKYLQRARETIKNELPYEKGAAQDISRAASIHDRFDILILGALGFGTMEDNVAEWRERAAEIPRLGVDYFFGPWRNGYVKFGEKLDLSQARQALAWMDPYRESLMTGLYLRAERDLSRLIEWPGADLPDDEGTTDRTPGDRAFYILLSQWLRGEQADPSDPARQTILAGTRRRPKLLLIVLDALIANDVLATRAALTKFLQNYKKTEFRADRVDLAISTDATILWHAATRHGIRLEALPPDLGAFILP